MHIIWTVTRLTFHEAWRRRMALAAVILGILMLSLYSLGLWQINIQLQEEGPPPQLLPSIYSFILMAGLYVVHFLTVMLAIFASVDTVAGEISSHTIQSLVTKPVQRWQVILGKWLGFAAMLLVFLGLLAGGMMLATYLLVGYTPRNIAQGLALLLLESLVLLSVSMLGGTRLSTLTNGVAIFLLYGLSFVGAWVEQIGAILNIDSAVRIGIIASLLMPVEALWRRAAFVMQPTVSNSIPTPFAVASVPSGAMVVYALLYALLAVLLAMRSFSRRDL